METYWSAYLDILGEDVRYRSIETILQGFYRYLSDQDIKGPVFSSSSDREADLKRELAELEAATS